MGATRVVLVIVFVLCAGCGLLQRLPSPVLTTAGDRPALFLGSEPDAARIGYLSADVPLTITGRARAGRVPVRIDGALRTRGFVDARWLSLRTQRRGRVRGTPLYVGPRDLVGVVGRESLRRLRVRAQATLRGQPFGPVFEGSYPASGLAAHDAPAEAPLPEAGRPYAVSSRMSVPLFDMPNGVPTAELPAQEAPYEVRVVNQHEGWLAVRAGDGPYLIGWTQAPLQPVDATIVPPAGATIVPPAGATVPPPPAPRTRASALPARLVEEPGALKRVAAGTKVVFGDSVIGVFKRAGYARIVNTYERAGYADVFAAADDRVALRGLIRTSDLAAPP